MRATDAAKRFPNHFPHGKDFQKEQKGESSLKKTIVVAVLSLALIVSGCSTSWIAEVSNILADVAPALINVLNIVAIAEKKPVDANLTAKITQDAANLKTLSTDLAAASAAAAPTICAQTQAAANALTADAGLVLQVVQVSAASSQTNAMDVFQEGDAFVNTIVGLLPSCAVPPAAAKKAFLDKAQALDSGTLRRAYNTALTHRTGNALVDAYNKNHKLPVHGRFVHVLTLDRVK